MAPAPRPASSVPMVIGGLLLVVISLLAFWLLREDQPLETGTPPSTAPADPVPGTAMTLPEPQAGPGQGSARAVEATPIPVRPPREREAASPTGDNRTFDEPVVVLGWVEDEQQKRRPDVEVNLFDDVGEYLDSMITDERGEFVFTSEIGLAAGWALGTEPELLDESDPDATVPAYYTHPRAVLPGDEPARCRLVLSTPPRLEGRVYDAVSGLPIDMADVELVCLSRAWETEWQDTWTDEAGVFSMNIVDVPPRDLILRVADDEDRYAIFGPLTLVPGEVRYIDVPLSDPVAIRGTVLSAHTADPVGAAEVKVLPAHREFEASDAWDITDEDGGWMIDDPGVPADRIWIYVSADGFGPELVQVTANDQPIEVRLGEPVLLTGQVHDAVTGEPVQDAVLRVLLNGPAGLDEDVEDMEFVDPDGSFRLPLQLVPAAAAEVIVECDGYLRFRAHLADIAPVATGAASHALQISLRPLPAS